VSKGDLQGVKEYALAHHGTFGPGYGLALACRYGHLRLAEFMIRCGANTKSELSTGLANACFRGHMHMVKFMICQGANDWNFGLTNACYCGNLDIVNLMIDHGANAWARGFTTACYANQLQAVQLMLSKSESTLVSIDWNCGLISACRGKSLQVVAFLLSKGVYRYDLITQYLDITVLPSMVEDHQVSLVKLQCIHESTYDVLCRKLKHVTVNVDCLVPVKHLRSIVIDYLVAST
jgi:hypothetical protein